MKEYKVDLLTYIHILRLTSKPKVQFFFKLNFKSHPMEVVSNLNLVLISTLPLRILRTN